MPGINNQKYFAPATRADVGTPTINTVVALQSIMMILKAMKAGQKPSDEDFKRADEAIAKLHQHFNQLSGWFDA